MVEASLNMPQGNETDLASLIRRQKPGMSLEQPFYTSAAIFERDLERIVARQWLYVDHVSRLPQAGDYLLYEVAGESIILVRGRDAELRAFFNVCRHRGSRICLKPEGNLRTLTCPYHAWVWDLEGNLKGARTMPEDFDPADWPLHRCQVRVWHGLIFINLAEEDDPDAVDFAVMQDNLDRFLAPNQLARAKVAATKVYPTAGNWKLAVENFRECYHCAPAHPEYTLVNAYVRDEEDDPGTRDMVVRAWRARWAERGRETGRTEPWTNDPYQPHGAFRQPIREGYQTLSEDGRPVAPLMGDLDAFDGGETLVIFGPLFYVYLGNDHATLFRFTPTSPTMTDVTLTWLVREDAPDEEVDVERLVWMWDVTTVEDTTIIGDNQLGVNSRRYRPGPYSLRERGTTNFTAWYLERMAGVSGGRATQL